MAPPRVLVITTAYPLPHHPEFPITPWLWQLLEEAQKHGPRIEILASAYQGFVQDPPEPFRVHRYRYAPARLETLTHRTAIYDALKQNPARWALVPLLLAGGLIRAAQLQRHSRYDVVHVHWPLPFALLALPFRHTPLLYTFHGSDLAFLIGSGKIRRTFAPLIRRATAITVNSRFTRQRLLRHFPDLPRVEVLPMPPALQIPPPETWPPRDPHRILFVGRFVELKGGHVLLQAFARVLQAVPEAHLVMIGSGPEEETWKTLARQLGVASRITFRGSLPAQQLADEYPRAAIVAVPSYEIGTGQTEALGVVAIEAQAFGTPVVASRTGGLPEVVLHEKTGLLVPERDPEVLARALIRLLRDAELRRRLGEAARKHYEQHFSVQSLGRRLADLYQLLASRRN